MRNKNNKKINRTLYISNQDGQFQPSRFLVDLATRSLPAVEKGQIEKCGKKTNYLHWSRSQLFIFLKFFQPIGTNLASLIKKIKRTFEKIWHRPISQEENSQIQILKNSSDLIKPTNEKAMDDFPLEKDTDLLTGDFPEKNYPPSSLIADSSVVKTEIGGSDSQSEPFFKDSALKKSGCLKTYFWRRRFLGALNMAIILFLIILPVKFIAWSNQNNWSALPGQVKGVSEEAADNFSTAIANLRDFDFSAAVDNFQKAGRALENARLLVGQINDNVLLVFKHLPMEKLRLAGEASTILNIGEIGAAIGEHLTLAAAAWQGSEQTAWAEKIYSSRVHIAAAARFAEEFSGQLSGISEKNIPEQYRQEFIQGRETAAQVTDILRELSLLSDRLSKILGFEHKARYLLVFQNNSEMRGSGGFVGSYALLDIDRGEIKNLEVPAGGSYDTEGGLMKNIVAPEPLWLVNPRWHFWDANWWPDWPMSAKKLAWFLEKSNGPTVDGVIALTPTVVEDMLRLTGPIQLGDPYQVVINADNFWSVVQTEVEDKTSQENTPKKIIGDFLPLLLDCLAAEKDGPRLAKLADIFWQAMNEKNILFYFTDSDLQELSRAYGWSGEMKSTKWDYLMVAHTNIAGGKSDRAIRETIKHEATVEENGEIIDTLTIIREHTASKQDMFVGVRNNDWLRVYVPLGSKLLEADGFSRPDSQYFSYPEAGAEPDPDILKGEGQSFFHYPSGTKIYNELGRTVFANWTQVDPGQTLVVTFKYKLPFRFSPMNFPDPETLNEVAAEVLSPYVLLIEKQPGAKTFKFNSRLDVKPAAAIVWRYPKGLETSAQGWEVSLDLNRQAYLAALFQAPPAGR